MFIASLGISQLPPLGGKHFQTMAAACTERQSLLGHIFEAGSPAITNRIV